MPTPRKRLTHKDVLKWKRMGPKQAEAAMKQFKTKGERRKVLDMAGKGETE